MSEEQMNDSTFNRLFIIMIVAMTVLTVIIMVLASFASSDVNERLQTQSDAENTDSIAERLAPVGSFSATTIATPTEPVVIADLTGADAYAPCAACHASGAAGAPIVGDVAVWTERLTKGTETLYSNAINGINAMPAKGGLDLSDNTVKAAVDYMIEQSQ